MNFCENLRNICFICRDLWRNLFSLCLRRRSYWDLFFSCMDCFINFSMNFFRNSMRGSSKKVSRDTLRKPSIDIFRHLFSDNEIFQEIFKNFCQEYFLKNPSRILSGISLKNHSFLWNLLQSFPVITSEIIFWNSF